MVLRLKKKKKNKTPALKQNPQVKGICIKILIKTPKKPNSALRKLVKLKLSNSSKIDAYIPGEGHSLQEYSLVLIRRPRPDSSYTTESIHDSIILDSKLH